jgi:6-pyruvoyl-tetrahydropterin synthase
MTALTGVGCVFSASHNDAVRKELHGHSYVVWAWFDYQDRDAMVLQEQLKAVVKAEFDHKTLPPERSREEDMAKVILGTLAGCVKVEITRPLEMLGTRVGSW